MAIQIREAVRNSLNDFVEFFQLYEEGNDYDGDYSDMRYVYQCVSNEPLCMDGFLGISHFGTTLKHCIKIF